MLNLYKKYKYFKNIHKYTCFHSMCSRKQNFHCQGVDTNIFFCEWVIQSHDSRQSHVSFWFSIVVFVFLRKNKWSTCSQWHPSIWLFRQYTILNFFFYNLEIFFILKQNNVHASSPRLFVLQFILDTVHTSAIQECVWQAEYAVFFL